MTERGLAMLKMFERFEPEVYPDAVGKLTVGYGHLVKPGEAFDAPLTEPEAVDLLGRDVEVHEREMLELVSVPLLDHQRDALVSFVFNSGATNFRNSTLRKLLNAGYPHHEVADQFPRWVFGTDEKGRKVKLRGLVRRRNVEAALFLGAGPELLRAIYEQA